MTCSRACTPRQPSGRFCRDRLIDFEGQLLILAEVVVERPASWRVERLGRLIGLARRHLLRQFGDLFQVFLILDCLGLAGRNDLVQQRRHLLVIGRIVEMLLDDLAADVVLDGLGDGVLVALEAAEHAVDGFGNAGFHDQVEQRHVVKRRNLPRLVGFDVGVDEVAHVRLVGFQVEALAAGLADDLAKFQIAVDFVLDAARCRPSL